jgi:XTP/dITP diphosphohydrolase
MKLIIASNNKHKIREIKEILGDRFDSIISLKEAGIDHDTVEDGATFVENARKKAREICALSSMPTLADDSGICVDHLGGAPGIYSARFAGEHGNDKLNNATLLKKLKGVTDRKAHYTCAMVIAYPDGSEVSAEGYMHGNIGYSEAGEGGFGYDPLFIPLGLDKTLAEITEQEKNKISHRKNALEALLSKL